MTAVYDKNGLHFLYPENWALSEEQDEESLCQITLQSPQSGYWELYLYDKQVEPLELATETLRIMKLEYDDLEADQVVERFGEIEAVGFNMDFYCIDFVVTSQIRSFRLKDRVVLLVYQGETREFEGLNLVFQAITTSFLRGQTEAEV